MKKKMYTVQLFLEGTRSKFWPDCQVVVGFSQILHYCSNRLVPRTSIIRWAGPSYGRRVGKSPFGRTRCKWEGNIKTDLRQER
jgi:hypothetical protein